MLKFYTQLCFCICFRYCIFYYLFYNNEEKICKKKALVKDNNSNNFKLGVNLLSPVCFGHNWAMRCRPIFNFLYNFLNKIMKKMKKNPFVLTKHIFKNRATCVDNTKVFSMIFVWMLYNKNWLSYYLSKKYMYIYIFF